MANGNAGEVSATLRLNLDRVAGDAAQAGKIVQQEAAKATSGLPQWTPEQIAKRDARVAANQAAAAANPATEAIKQQMAKVAASSPEGVRRLKESLGQQQEEKNREEPESDDNATGSAVGRALIGQILGGRAGALIGVASSGPQGAATAAVIAQLMLFKKVLQETVAAADRARAAYVNQVRSGGLGMGFVAQRSALARVIGVSEQEVFQYTSAIEHLNGRLQTASDVTAKANPRLTALSLEFGVLSENVTALWTEIALSFAPAVNSAVTGLSVLTEWLLKLASNPLIKIAMTASETIMTGGLNMIGQIFGGTDKLGSVSGAGGWSKQQISSPWERMGLVLGIGGNVNYQKQVAENTRRLVKILEKSGSGAPSGLLLHAPSAPSQP